ncbi:DUF1491 family protein [Chelativorans sp. ZYF759]|uniref:DUF1491 family protein n=1 Tax=Chelativorans sp. ZYF759 TaxID=2692213 RepID=UPI00145F4644|nr:DUF1491 family protein [Chelativorans sp. ZYF759]NMG38972.1 DUF1491 family protein [Chelativorans sp. ZYF759]
MRLTSDFWISALIRRAFGAGGYAAVVRRGATEAGAIFITNRSRDGMYRLYGPAAQTSYDEAGPQERRFALLLEGEEELISTRLEKESRFDPDLWVVEIEAEEAAVIEWLPLTTP